MTVIHNKQPVDSDAQLAAGEIVLRVEMPGELFTKKSRNVQVLFGWGKFSRGGVVRGKYPGRGNFPDWVMSWDRNVRERNVCICMEVCKSLRLAVMIYATLVNTQTDIHTRSCVTSIIFIYLFI